MIEVAREICSERRLAETRAKTGGPARRSSRNERGGYDCQLVEPPPSHIQTECSICLQLLKEPCIVSCCGHKFCRECIELVRAADKDCPLCNAHGFSFMPEHSLDRTLLGLKVFCSAKAQGCTWSGQLRELGRHLNETYSAEEQLSGCGFTEVTCIHSDCGVVLERRLATDHQSKLCGRRPHSCEHCGDYTSTYEDVTGNHHLVCGRYPISCPKGCLSSQIERRFMEQHLKRECPLVVVECQFNYSGCLVTLPRREMSAHTEDVFAHFSMLASVTRTLVCENKQLKSQIAKVEAEAEEREQCLQTRLGQLTIACCTFQHFVQHRELTNFLSATQTCDFIVNSSAVLATMEMELRSKYFAVLPYNFKMEQFLSYKGGQVEYSPIFYTHPLGYKFRVKVVRTEYSKLLSLDAFTSVYIEILSGPFDDKLDWPFKGSITVAIVNQLGDFNHHEKVLQFSNECKKGARPKEHGCISCGVRPFIYHKELRQKHTKNGKLTHYLDNGTLHFCITKIKLT